MMHLNKVINMEINTLKGFFFLTLYWNFWIVSMSTNLSNPKYEMHQLWASSLVYLVHYWGINWTEESVSYSSLENFMVSTTDCACRLNIGPVFTSKWFEMLQIVLRGLVPKSGSEWAHRKSYTFSRDRENSCKKPNSTHTLYSELKR